MKRLVFLVFFIQFASYFALAADEIPVNIKAEKLKYIEDTGIVAASGSVEIRLEDITILSDSLVMDTRTKVVTAEGNVSMRGPEYDARGSFMTYNLDDETSSFSDFKTILSPREVKGNLYLGADEIKETKTSWEGYAGSITTCDYATSESQHYFVASRKVEYYPNDKIIGYSNTFYIGRVPCLWAPYVVYDLKNRRKRNWAIGHNEVEGNFIKTFWDYPSGIIILDYMEKKGLGHGLEYNYDLKQNGSGKIYFYLLNESDPPNIKDRIFKINHSIKPTPWSTFSIAQGSSYMYLIPSGRLDSSTYRLDYDYKKDDRRFNSFLDVLDNRGGSQERLVFEANNSQNNYNTGYNFSLDQGKVEPRYVRISQRLNHNQPFLLKNGTLNFNANYSDSIQKVGTPGDELLNLDYEFINRESFYTLRVYENWHIDLDRNLYLGDEGEQYLEKQPEITLSPNPVDCKLFTLSSTLGFGYYREVQQVPSIGKRSFSAGRYLASLRANRSVPLILGSTLSLSYGINQYLYDPGDQLYSQEENIALNTGLFNCFNNNINFVRGISDGNTPFFFDRLGTKYSNIKDTANLYYGEFATWVVSGGYNFETKKQFNTDTMLTLKPNNIMRASFTTGWDPENLRYLDLSSNAALSLEKLSNSTSLLYDLNNGLIKSGSNLLDFEIADETDWKNHWHFKVGHVYNPVSQELKMVDFSAVKDLHCWEVKYTYSDYRKEFSITFTLKALPGEPIGYAGGRGFYFDSFEKSLKEDFPGASPVRY